MTQQKERRVKERRSFNANNNPKTRDSRKTIIKAGRRKCKTLNQLIWEQKNRKEKEK